jgi:hypothetical protein
MRHRYISKCYDELGGADAFSQVIHPSLYCFEAGAHYLRWWRWLELTGLQSLDQVIVEDGFANITLWLCMNCRSEH